MDYLHLDKKKVEIVAQNLNSMLAAYQLHYQKLRNFHWNLKSQDFFVLHDKFEQFYTDANEKIDDLAERILTLRVRPVSQLSEYLKISKIKECPEDLNHTQMVNEVLNDYSVLIQLGRDVLKAASEAEDEGTIDMLGGYVGDLEKNCWMLSSYLEKHKPRAFEIEESQLGTVDRAAERANKIGKDKSSKAKK
ncbi:Dps family protein [Cesiribacter andamanensis]|uniref:DNA protection during starvation protein n=1 Tax=Cesiribacter andamanensis AMV16 TaxID=1279009 RepID=M7NCF2_9BACT|nr:Dps family protein [Cesiribacter andamanensis]EMR04836.1 DNA protection during starvation protein [Cesiribacter andamanensis AMV16]